MDKILVPTDFSGCCQAALKWAVFLGRRFPAQVDVLHVWELPQYAIPELAVHMPGEPKQSLIDLARSNAIKEMDRFLAEVKREGGVAVKGHLASGDPTETIVEVARQRLYGLIVMGTHGRKGLSHLLLGSVAEKVIRRASCPVLTIRQYEGQVSEPLEADAER